MNSGPRIKRDSQDNFSLFNLNTRVIDFERRREVTVSSGKVLHFVFVS